ncbi:MAG TPA: hypothetical protein VFI26_07835 [Lysobacter sp.]|jgi:hypothetical protein|nr:hypothetical protein [Lysobacter sp.]
MNTRPNLSFENIVLLALAALGFAWIWFSEGFDVFAHYVFWIACIICNSALIIHFIKPAAKRRNFVGYALILSVLVLNSIATYLVYPNVLLLLGFWLPGLIGWLVGRLYRVAP